MSDHRDPVQRRATLLPLLLGGILIGFLSVVLILITSGFFFYVVLLAGGMAAVGMFHWLAWGKWLTEQTAGEREEMDLLDRARREDDEPVESIHRR